MLDHTDLVAADVADYVDEAIDCMLDDHAVFGEDRTDTILKVAAWMLETVCERQTDISDSDEEKVNLIENVVESVKHYLLEGILKTTIQ